MTLHKLADDLWIQTAPQSFFGLRLGTRMTVVRLQDGGLLVHSAIALSADLKAEVDDIGPVRHIVAPSQGHHLYVGEWQHAYPNALLHAATGLAKRRKDLSIDQELMGEVYQDWRDDLDALREAYYWLKGQTATGRACAEPSPPRASKASRGESPHLERRKRP